MSFILNIFLHLSLSEIFLGGVSQNFGRVCCSMGPQQSMFYCIFKKEFSEIWSLCCSMRPYFLEKTCQKFDTFLIFFKKSISYASIWSQMERASRILMESPIKLHTGRFKKVWKFWNFLKIWLPPNSLFIAFLRKKFWSSVLFYGSKNTYFVLLGPLGVGPHQEYLWSLSYTEKTDISLYWKFRVPWFQSRVHEYPLQPDSELGSRIGSFFVHYHATIPF